MNAAIKTELLKLRRSPVTVVATIALIVGILGLLAGITFGLKAENPQLMAKAGPAATLDWTGLLLSTYQIISVASLLAFGVVLGWIFGREFTEGTISGLFGLPTSRFEIAAAKFVAYLSWGVIVSATLTGGVLLLGVVFGYGMPPIMGLLKVAGLSLFSALVVVPVAWLTTLSRSVFAGVGITIALVVIAQVAALVGVGGWLPITAPASWALSLLTGGMVVVLVVPWVVFFVAVCCRSWDRLTTA